MTAKQQEIKKKVIRLNKSNLGWYKAFHRAKWRCEKDVRYMSKNRKFFLTEEQVEHIWIRDKATELQKPSLDRIDNNKDYTFDNCQFIENSLNSGKDKYMFIGSKARTWKIKGCLKMGHPWNEENVYTYPNGKHYCRACKRIRTILLKNKLRDK